MADEDKPSRKPVNFDNGETWGQDSVPLRFPFTLAGVTYDGVAFRVPSGHDIDAYYKNTSAGFRELAISLAQLDDKVFDKMHGSDYARVLAAVGKYVAGSL